MALLNIAPPYTKVGPWKNNPSATPFIFQAIYPTEKTNMTGWKIHHEWRCISLLKMEIFQPVMLVFRGDNPNFDKDLPWIYHQNPHKSKPPARTTWTEVQKPYHRKPFSGHVYRGYMTLPQTPSVPLLPEVKALMPCTGILWRVVPAPCLGEVKDFPPPVSVSPVFDGGTHGTNGMKNHTFEVDVR